MLKELREFISKKKHKEPGILLPNPVPVSGELFIYLKGNDGTCWKYTELGWVPVELPM